MLNKCRLINVHRFIHINLQILISWNIFLSNIQIMTEPQIFRKRFINPATVHFSFRSWNWWFLCVFYQFSLQSVNSSSLYKEAKSEGVKAQSPKQFFIIQKVLVSFHKKSSKEAKTPWEETAFGVRESYFVLWRGLLEQICLDFFTMLVLNIFLAHRPCWESGWIYESYSSEK